ncbi:MAG TPA: hypothetical protein VF503_11415 [Sphingobium sp.]|uniref:hypothetical protein n=1 Tax=Sphingobium sp. TaxID=1912891 RepID=UPI002ED3DE4F
MKALREAGTILLLGAAFALASCASRPPVETARPVPGITLPPLTEAPGAMAINQGLNADEMLWHLRVALNVAALACQDAAHATVASQYNAMLDRHKTALAAAYDAEVARFRQQYGAAWQDAFDHHQTRLYNLFADPRATRGLCDQALAIGEQMNGAAPVPLATFAGTALARIEQPFLATRPLAMGVPPGATPLGTPHPAP